MNAIAHWIPSYVIPHGRKAFKQAHEQDCMATAGEEAPLSADLEMTAATPQ